MRSPDPGHCKAVASSEGTERPACGKRAKTTVDTSQAEQAGFTEADTNQAIGSRENLLRALEELRVAQLGHQEMLDYLSPPETEVDRMLQELASRTPVLPVEQCRKLASEMSTTIFEDWTTLKFFAIYFEVIVQKRWRKMSLVRRRELLLEVWPGMSAKHRPDLDRWMSLGSVGQDPDLLQAETGAYNQAALWPYGPTSTSKTCSYRTPCLSS